MKEGKPGIPDHAAIASEQMRQSFIRKQKASAFKRSSDTYSPNEYAEEKTEKRAEAVASEIEIYAERAAGTILRPSAYPEDLQPTTKHTLQQSAAIRTYAQREKERQETEKELRRPAGSFESYEASYPDHPSHSLPTRRKRSNWTPSSGQSESEFSSDRLNTSYFPSHGYASLDYSSSENAFRPASFAHDIPMPSRREIVNTAQEAGRREFIFSHQQKQSVRRTEEKAKKLKNDLRAIARNKEVLLKALTAGGGIALTLAVFILLIGAVGGSGFGIFFSAGDKGDYTIRSAMREINQDYTSRVNAIKTSHYYDELDLSGARSGWREVLAVYAVKSALDTVDPIDVVTMTPEKQEGLSAVFWDMNELTSEVLTRTDTETVASEDEEGNPLEEEIQRTVTILSVKVHGKTAWEMAEEYSFTSDQRQQLQELLSPEYGELWSLVLYGVSMADGEIVSIALSQVGNVGGDPYWSWYGFSHRVEWCACFVSWCANEAGYIEAGIIPIFSYCPTGAAWFQSRGQWADRNFEPTPGCLIFYDWESDGEIDHVGIVENCEGGLVHTVEGNAGDICARCAYWVGSSVIVGYGIPEY